jgi:hypothetical protein
MIQTTYKPGCFAPGLLFLYQVYILGPTKHAAKFDMDGHKENHDSFVANESPD